MQRVLDGIYRAQGRRVFATLVRLLGDFDLAEEALADAFVAAAEQWPASGVPANPRALARFGRPLQSDRRHSSPRGFDASLAAIAQRVERLAGTKAVGDDEEIEDDRLRLIFTCCHPSLAPATQVALTLREICGLKTEEIAAAFLTTPSTIAQRIVRGKAKIRDDQIPYQVPAIGELPERLESVLAVVYLAVQRRLLGLVGRSTDPARSVGRGDPAGTLARRVAA